jgi:hypothetical protein
VNQTDGRIWKGLVVVATALLIGDTFLHWIFGGTFWRINHSLHMKVAIGIAVVIAGGLCLLTLGGRTAFDRLAGAVALFAGGGAVIWALYVTSFHPHVAAWLAIVFGAAMALGGLMMEYSDVAAALAPGRAGPAAPTTTPLGTPTAAPLATPTATPLAPSTTPPASAVAQPQSVSPEPMQEVPAAEQAQGGPAAQGSMSPPKAADMTEPLVASVPAGWYPDPSGEHDERLWDGSAWTHEVR